jgi:hypothetical protein
LSFNLVFVFFVTIFHPAQRDSSGKTSKKDFFTDLKKLPFSFCILALKRLMVLVRLSLNCYIFNSGGLRIVVLLETLQRTLLANGYNANKGHQAWNKGSWLGSEPNFTLKDIALCSHDDVLRSEEEVRAKKAELLTTVIEKHNKIDHGFGRDDTTAEIDGKIYALEYVLGERRDI